MLLVISRIKTQVFLRPEMIRSCIKGELKTSQVHRAN